MSRVLKTKKHLQSIFSTHIFWHFPVRPAVIYCHTHPGQYGPRNSDRGHGAQIDGDGTRQKAAGGRRPPSVNTSGGGTGGEHIRCGVRKAVALPACRQLAVAAMATKRESNRTARRRDIPDDTDVVRLSYTAVVVLTVTARSSHSPRCHDLRQ